MSTAPGQNGSADSEAMSTPQAMEAVLELLQRPPVVDALAGRVAELLAPRLIAAFDQAQERPADEGLVDAAALAALLGVTRSFVYEHAEELGAVPLGEGPKPRLRFDVERARAAFSRSTGKGSQVAQSQVGSGEAAASAIGRGARLPRRLPQPGSVLRVRGGS